MFGQISTIYSLFFLGWGETFDVFIVVRSVIVRFYGKCTPCNEPWPRFTHCHWATNQILYLRVLPNAQMLLMLQPDRKTLWWHRLDVGVIKVTIIQESNIDILQQNIYHYESRKDWEYNRATSLMHESNMYVLGMRHDALCS